MHTPGLASMVSLYLPVERERERERCHHRFHCTSSSFNHLRSITMSDMNEQVQEQSEASNGEGIDTNDEFMKMEEATQETNSKKESAWKDADFLSLDAFQAENDEDKNDDGDGDEEGEEEVDESFFARGMTIPTYVDSRNNHRNLRDPRQQLALQQEQQQKSPPWMTIGTKANREPNTGRGGHLLNDPSQYKNPLVSLHNEIVDFCSLMEPMEEEIQQRQDLLEKIKKFIHSIFDDKNDSTKTCEVCLFGSQATGLFLPSSDIDLVVKLKGYDDDDDDKKDDQEKVTDNGKQQKKKKKAANAKAKQQEKKEMDEWDKDDAQANQSPLLRLGAALRDQWRDELSYLEVIPNTRVPLVKFTHESTNISVDICFNQDTGPKAAELVKTYLNAMPPLRPLTFVMKYFMEARGMNEPYSGGVGSFMLQLMIVSFLQHRERDGYNFERPTLANLGCLLVEFLELYGMDFNYVTTGISVRHDGFFFPKGHSQRKEFFFQPSRPFSLAMENPLEPTADVGKPSFRIQTVQRSFEVSFKVLLAHVTEPRVQSSTYGESILASILPPTKEMKQRAILKNKKASASALSKSNSNNDNSRRQQQHHSQRNNDNYKRNRNDIGEPSRKKRRRR